LFKTLTMSDEDREDSYSMAWSHPSHLPMTEAPKTESKEQEPPSASSPFFASVSTSSSVPMTTKSDIWSDVFALFSSLCSASTTACKDAPSERKFTFGERLADQFSITIGSWRFVSTQSVLLITWLLINAMTTFAWDPYPFILLNLMLSFQAAYTAPIIMMSQNRQADVDRVKSFDLHEKVDHIRSPSMSFLVFVITFQ